MNAKIAVFTGLVRALVVKNGKILLVREKDEGTWETPGGAIETVDRTPKDACKREVLEEIGYECDVGSMIDLHFFEHKGKKAFWIVYECRLGKKIKEPDEDVEEVRWFSKKEIKELLDQNKVDDHDLKAFNLFVNDKINYSVG